MCAKYYGITDIMENNGEKVCTPSIKMLKCIKQKTWKIETLWKIPANNFENLFDKYWKERKIFSCKNNDLGPWSPSSYVMIFSAVAINVMKLSVLTPRAYTRRSTRERPICRIWHSGGGHHRECIYQKSAKSIEGFLRKRVFCVFSCPGQLNRWHCQWLTN